MRVQIGFGLSTLTSCAPAVFNNNGLGVVSDMRHPKGESKITTPPSIL